MVAISMMGVGDARSQTMGLRLPLTFFFFSQVVARIGSSIAWIATLPSPGRSSWDGHRAAERELWTRSGLC